MKQTELTAAQQHLSDKITAAYPTDERTSRAAEKGLAACGICALIYVVTRFIYCGFHGRLPLPEIVLLVLMSICISAANRAYRVIELPRYFGRTVDPAPSARPKRILLYALTGLMLGASWTMVDFFGHVTDWGSAPQRIAADIGITSVVCAVCETVIGEIKVHRYNSEAARLEAEENDLSD